MFEQKRIIAVTDRQQRVMVRGLTNARNDAIREGKPTEDLDEVILMTIDAPTKREKRRADREAR
ncbi:MAG: hypothetical protein K2M42_03555 [Oscillospiraceae bacterium]|nr:hypothetical protein [Oscillospiraceae bacterium]